MPSCGAGASTRAVLINTPHNPTGRIYPEAVLQRLADALATAAQRYGRPIWIISDEAYSRILFDERSFVSPAVFHPYSLLARTYSKSRLTPGQGLGYLALAPDVPDAEAMRQGLFSHPAPSTTQTPTDVADTSASRHLIAAACTISNCSAGARPPNLDQSATDGFGVGVFFRRSSRCLLKATPIERIGASA